MFYKESRSLTPLLPLLKCLKNSSNSYSFYLLFLYLPPASKPPIFFQESDKITIIANYLQNSFFYPSIEFIIPPIHLTYISRGVWVRFWDCMKPSPKTYIVYIASAESAKIQVKVSKFRCLNLFMASVHISQRHLASQLSWTISINKMESSYIKHTHL